MSTFPSKKFRGHVYSFEHLKRTSVEMLFNEGLIKVKIFVTFGSHCFTEEFKSETHNQEYVYRHNGELRAFDIVRYECSKKLPNIINNMANGTVYKSDKSYTYVSHIQIASLLGEQAYSIFFSLKKRNTINSELSEIHLDMYIKSAYPCLLKSKKNAQNWRFKGLVRQVVGAF